MPRTAKQYVKAKGVEARIEKNRPVRAEPDDFNYWVDLKMGPAWVEFVVWNDDVTFHGLTVSGVNNLGSEDPCDGTALPDGPLKTLLLELVAEDYRDE